MFSATPTPNTLAEAHQVLDVVRAGGVVPQAQVLAALWLTGDLAARCWPALRPWPKPQPEAAR